MGLRYLKGIERAKDMSHLRGRRKGKAHKIPKGQETGRKI
jgi:hypothetical protein